MIICVLLCYPVSFHMLQLLLTGHPISSYYYYEYSNGEFACIVFIICV